MATRKARCTSELGNALNHYPSFPHFLYISPHRAGLRTRQREAECREDSVRPGGDDAGVHVLSGGGERRRPRLLLRLRVDFDRERRRSGRRGRRGKSLRGFLMTQSLRVC
jgi:hypothetical protein